MTRQKKEILKKIQNLDNSLDMAYTMPYVSDSWCDEICDEIADLWEEFAQLSGFSCRWEQEEFEEHMWCQAKHIRYPDLPWV